MRRTTDPGEIRLVDDGQDGDAEHEQHGRVGMARPVEARLEAVHPDIAAHDVREEVPARLDGHEREQEDADEDDGVWLDSHSVQY